MIVPFRHYWVNLEISVFHPLGPTSYFHFSVQLTTNRKKGEGGRAWLSVSLDLDRFIIVP